MTAERQSICRLERHSPYSCFAAGEKRYSPCLAVRPTVADLGVRLLWLERIKSSGRVNLDDTWERKCPSTPQSRPPQCTATVEERECLTGPVLRQRDSRLRGVALIGRTLKRFYSHPTCRGRTAYCLSTNPQVNPKSWASDGELGRNALGRAVHVLKMAQVCLRGNGTGVPDWTCPHF